MIDKYVIEALGISFRMEILKNDPSLADHALYMQIKERWYAAVVQIVQSWTEPWTGVGPRLVYSAPEGQAPIEAPSPNGLFGKK